MSSRDVLPSGLNVGTFFDQLTDDYNTTIERCFPRYREMLWALLDYLPVDSPIVKILELGCGTGNLSVLLAERYPKANIRLVDISAESLDVCRRRLGPLARFELEQADFRDLAAGDEEFDLVISSISIHHLVADEKQVLFSKLYRWLAPGGLFAYADQFAGATDDLYQQHINHWKSLTVAAGSTPTDWEMWMQHQRDHDHHDPLGDQLGWLDQTGFMSTDCLWRYLLWAVVHARKPRA